VLYINEDLLQGNTVQKLELNCNRQWGTYDKENLAFLSILFSLGSRDIKSCFWFSKMPLVRVAQLAFIFQSNCNSLFGKPPFLGVSVLQFCAHQA